MRQVTVGIPTLGLVILLLVGCGKATETIEPASADTAEADSITEDEVTPPPPRGPAEELALEVSDIGAGWEKIRMDVKAKGNWIDQTFHHRYIEDKLEFTDQVTQIIRVYPSIESALLDSELCERRYRVSLLRERLEGLTEEDEYLREHLEDAIERTTSGLPSWDEVYQDRRVFLRKDNIIVIFEFFRCIRRYDPLSEGYTPILSFQLTPEQEQWLDEEHYVDEFLFSLAGKAEDKIFETGK